MLLRKSGASRTILVIALLVAILASTNAIVNYLNLQSELLARLVSPRGTYLILSSNSTAITDSKLNVSLTEKLANLRCFNYVLPQRLLAANLTTDSGSFTVRVRGVEDIEVFLKAREAKLKGEIAKNWEVIAGEVLARAFSISTGDEVSIAVGDKLIKVKVVGIFRSRTQSDAELIAPMQTLNSLTEDENTVSFIEFSLKRGISPETVSQIAQFLPENVKLVQAQQLEEFTRQMNIQTLSFLKAWSLAVYAVVAAASYIVATRLVIEFSYEFTVLRGLGAKKGLIFMLILSYIAVLTIFSSILGVTIGTVGVQVTSSLLRWILPSLDLTPFIEAKQVAQIVLFTTTFSILGSVYPALKFYSKTYG